MRGIEAREGEPRTDELDLARILLNLWRHRWWIVSGTLLVTALGVFHALTAPNVWRSAAIISLKDSQKSSGASSVLSQLGGLGGRMASQLGGANTSLDKLEIILYGEELAQSVIETHDLMPKLFREEWDSAKSAWRVKEPGKEPTIRKGAQMLSNGALSISVERIKQVMEVGVSMYDPVLARDMVEYYLAALQRKLREDAKAESATNRNFLESQLGATVDPIIREKIIGLIAMEIEKEMLVGNQSVEVLRKPTVPLLRASPNKKKIVILAFAAGLGLSVTMVCMLPLLRRLGMQKA